MFEDATSACQGRGPGGNVITEKELAIWMEEKSLLNPTETKAAIIDWSIKKLKLPPAAYLQMYHTMLKMESDLDS